ncbi:MAG: choice-of-anchor D domain-containing protein [Methylocella sp.]
MAGTWADLSKQPGASVDTMLLLTDGTVIAHQSDSPNWHQLNPNASGSYTNGKWTALQPMPPNNAIPAFAGGPTYGPLFFGSAVLGDGTVLIAGGEYNTGISADVAAATRYDPVTSAWTNLATPSGWTNVGDVPLCVLADGSVLLGNINDSQTAFFDPATGVFTAGPNKGDRCAEESFTLLPDDTVLTVDCSNIPNAEKYVPSSNIWVSAGSTPSTLPQACPGIVAEIGPTVLLTDGRAFVIGSTGDTALYIPPANPSDPGTWQAGPTIVDASNNRLHPIDAPAALLPNGRVLLAASPAPPCSFPGPTSFFEYDPATNTLNPVGTPSNSAGPCFTGRFLLLPNGQVLFSNQSAAVTIYTPDGAPNPSWKPAITAIPPIMAVGHHYLLSGRQFNGLSQACFYGDDATMATNYPIARLEQGAKVIYCRTARHSTMGVATGTQAVSTILSIPPSVPPGNYQLVAVANGIPSDPVAVTIVPALPAIAVDVENGGDFGTVCGTASLSVEITNVGDLDLIVDQVLALPNPGPFTVQPFPSTPVTLKPGAEVDFTITFTPTAVGTTQTGTIRITSNDPVTPTFDINVTATAGTGSLATAIADHGDFGKVCVGSFRDEPLTLANNGTCKLSVTDIASSSPDFLPPAVASYPLTVAPGTAIEFPIRFQPTGTGPVHASIIIDSDDLAGPKVVRVSGTAPPPWLTSLIADSGNFGKVCIGSFVDEQLILSNSGECLLSISAITSTSIEFLLPQVLSYPIHIGAGDSSPVPIRFQPESFGPKAATITVLSNDPASPSSVTVSGDAPSGKITVTGSTCFGGVPACTCAERVIAICNVGECHLHVLSVKFKRQNRHWKLINNPFPATLHPGSCLNLVIRYKATEQCPRSQDLIITSDDPVTPVKVLDVTAYTIWERCSCKKCCDDCRKGDCDKHHGECLRQCCCDDDDDHRHHKDEDDDQ